MRYEGLRARRARANALEKAREEIAGKRKSARARGYDAEWQRMRALAVRAWLDAGRPCAFCGREFQPHNTRGIHLDHIERVKDAPERRLDPTNWRCVHARCHSRFTAQEDQAKQRGFTLGADADGTPTDPAHPYNRGTRR